MDFAAKGEAEVLDGLRVERIDEGHVEAGFIELDRQRAVEAGGAGGDQREQRLGRGPVADVHDLGAELGGDDRPDVVAVLDDLEVGEDFGDFLAAVFDFREDVLGEAVIDEAAGLEEFDDLVVVHGWTVKTERFLKWLRSERSVGVGHGGVDDFGAGGEAGEDLADAVLAEGAHAEFAGAAAELGGGEAGVDHLTSTMKLMASQAQVPMGIT